MIDLIYDVTKEYTDMYKIVIYKNGLDPTKLKTTKNQKIKRSISNLTDERSVRRSRTVINDYVLCNHFNLFITFTFNPRKVNRYDLDLVALKMQGWLRRQHNKNPDFRYIIVPEAHKDGAIHFHALVGGYNGHLKKTNVIQNEKRVYNMTSFRFGFTNAQYLDENKQKTIAYLCKYITKDMVTVSNRRRYWCSKNLTKPIVHHNKIYNLGINSLLNHKTVQFETDYNVIHHVTKKQLQDLGV